MHRCVRIARSRTAACFGGRGGHLVGGTSPLGLRREDGKRLNVGPVTRRRPCLPPLNPGQVVQLGCCCCGELLALASPRNGVDAFVGKRSTNVEAILHSILADLPHALRTRGTCRLGVGAVSTSADGQPQSQQQPENDFRVRHRSSSASASARSRPRIRYSWRRRGESRIVRCAHD